MRLLSAFVTLDRIGFAADANGMFFGLNARAIPARINLRELRSEKTDQRRVVNPEQQDRQGTGRAKRTARRGPSEINTDSVFSPGKKQRRHGGSDPHVLP